MALFDETSLVPALQRGWSFTKRETLAMALSMADQIWNRACLQQGGSDPRPGDVALAAMLRVHSLAMSGGLLDAIENLSDGEVVDGVAGYRYFRLDAAAEVVEWVKTQIEGANPAALDVLESEADQRYAAEIQTDSVLTSRFEAVYRDQQEAFAPVE